MFETTANNLRILVDPLRRAGRDPAWVTQIADSLKPVEPQGEQAVIAAVVDRSREQALRAFTIHPLVGSPTIARQLLDGVLADDPVLAELLR
jgi:6-phospho-beta-glucosidase